MSSKRSIGIFIGQLLIGGAEKQSILLAKGLMDFFEVHFIVFKGHRVEPSNLSILYSLKVTVHILEGNFFLRIIRLFYLLRNYGISVLFCYLPLDNIIGTITGRIAGVKYIIGGIRNTKIVRKKFYLLRIFQKYLQDYVIFNSHKAKEVFCNHGYIKDNCIVIENAITERIDFPDRTNKMPVNILMVGRFVEQKDYLTGIKAISHLYYDLNFKSIRVTIAGFGELEDTIRVWIERFKLEEIADILIKPDNLTQLYTFSDIFFNSSIFEGLSNSIIEAMIHGLPIVATNTGDIEKQVVHGRNGFISDVGDYETLGKNLYTLCMDYSTRIEFGRISYHMANQIYGFEHFQKKYLNFICRLK